MEKKIGLVTYYGNNYGGCLQAYALQETIRNLGYIPQIVQVITPMVGQKKTILSAIWRVLSNPVAYILRRPYIQQHTTNDIRRNEAFDKYRNKYLCFDKSFVLTLTSSGNSLKKYDTIVCGSDQIWNPFLYGVHPIWTLKIFSKKTKRIAYAPSLGISDIPKEFVKDFKENLDDFSFLSVREQEGADSLSKVLDKPVDVVLDPTLLLTSKQWQEFAEPVDIKRPYIFCYLFGDYEYITKVKNKARKYLNMDVVCLPYNLRELKDNDIKLYDITPNQFVWLIANAEIVITDSFHASVFSIKMNTPFIALKRSSDNDIKNMNSRLYTLLHTAGLEDRMLGETMVASLEEIIDKNINFIYANEKIMELAQRDISKLSKALSDE